MRHCRKNVMHHVRVGNVVVKMVEDGAIISVDGCQCSSQKSPIVSSKMRNILVGVLQIGNQNQPEVNHKIWSNVKKENVSKAVNLGEHEQSCQSQQNSDIADDDVVALFFVEDWRVGVEMVNPLSRNF